MRVSILFFCLLLPSCLIKKGKVSPLSQMIQVDQDFEEIRQLRNICDLDSFKMLRVGDFGLVDYEDSMGLLKDVSSSGDLKVFDQDLSFSLWCTDTTVVETLFEHYKTVVIPDQEASFEDQELNNKGIIASVVTLGRNYLLNKKYYSGLPPVQRIDNPDDINFKSSKLASIEPEHLVKTRFLNSVEEIDGLSLEREVERHYPMSFVLQDVPEIGQAKINGTSLVKGVAKVTKEEEDPTRPKLTFVFNSKGLISAKGHSKSDLEKTRKINEELTVVQDLNLEEEEGKNNVVFTIKKTDVALKSLPVPIPASKYKILSRAVTLKATYSAALTHYTHFYDSVLRARYPKGERKVAFRKIKSYLDHHFGKAVLKLTDSENRPWHLEAHFLPENQISFKVKGFLEAETTDTLRLEEDYREELLVDYSTAVTSYDRSDQSFLFSFSHDEPIGVVMASLFRVESGVKPLSVRLRYDSFSEQLFMEFPQLVKVKEKGEVRWEDKSTYILLDFDLDGNKIRSQLMSYLDENFGTALIVLKDKANTKKKVELHFKEDHKLEFRTVLELDKKTKKPLPGQKQEVLTTSYEVGASSFDLYEKTFFMTLIHEGSVPEILADYLRFDKKSPSHTRKIRFLPNKNKLFLEFDWEVPKENISNIAKVFIKEKYKWREKFFEIEMQAIKADKEETP